MSARAVRLPAAAPAGGGSGAGSASRGGAKAGGGQRRSRCLAHFAGGPGQSWGGGSSACFARVARLALLVRVGEVLGVGGGAAVHALLASLACTRPHWRGVGGWGGGSSACFARVARLALVRVGGVLGVVVRWRGNGQQRWGWRWGGHFSGVVFMGRRRWRIGGGRGVVTVLAPARWCWRGRDPTINKRWKVEGGSGGRQKRHGVGGGG